MHREGGRQPVPAGAAAPGALVPGRREPGGVRGRGGDGARPPGRRDAARSPRRVASGPSPTTGSSAGATSNAARSTTRPGPRSWTWPAAGSTGCTWAAGWWSRRRASGSSRRSWPRPPGSCTPTTPTTSRSTTPANGSLAHGLAAHLHVADPWSTLAPDPGPADGLFAAFLVGRVRGAGLDTALATLRDRLRAGGRLAILDLLPDPDGGPPPGQSWTFHEPTVLEASLRRAGLGAVSVATTGRFLLEATGVAR